MRSNLRAVVVAALAICALSGLGASSATAALPEYVSKSGGHEGSLDISIPGTITMHTTSGIEIQCKYGAMVAILSGSTLRGTARLGQCELDFLGKYSCRNGGTESENWILAHLTGKLGYIEKATKKVGVELAGETGETAILASGIHCALLTTSGTSIIGHVIGKIGPVNTLTKHFTLEYAEKGGIQEIGNFEGGPLEQHLSFLWEVGSTPERLGLQMTGFAELVGTNGEGEIKA